MASALVHFQSCSSSSITKEDYYRFGWIKSSQLLCSRSYEPELTISEVKVSASCHPESDAADVFLKSSLTWNGIAYFSLPTFVTKPLNQVFIDPFWWLYWHDWYDCTGIIGMIVLCVAFVCSAKGGCETQPAAHLDNDMKHNILHILHAFSICKMHSMSKNALFILQNIASVLFF